MCFLEEGGCGMTEISVGMNFLTSSFQEVLDFRLLTTALPSVSSFC